MQSTTSRIATTILITGGLAACLPPSAPSPARTSANVSIADVESRIYIAADDSMQGRQSGTPGNFRMTTYLEREVRRMGLEPAGENGTYFQVVPMVRRIVDSSATQMSVDGSPLRQFAEFAALRPNSTERYGVSLRQATYETVYGGVAGDSLASLPEETVRGRIVILDAPRDSTGRPSGVWGTAGAISVSRFPTAAAIAIANLNLITPIAGTSLGARSTAVGERPGAPARPVAFLVTGAVESRIMNGDLTGMRPGTRGKDVVAAAAFIDEPMPSPARNVIAILRGSDPTLRNEYVALGAHSDHVGLAPRPVEHDSLRAYYRVMRPEGAQRRGAQPGDPTPAQWREIGAILDSLRRLRPPRLDSIFNGADDDASGSVALLEIAENLVALPRPKRSVLFVWHTAEEGGLLGSAYFTQHPTVPLASVVAQINMDMVGRGGAHDIAGGGPRYLQVIGSRRLSSELGNVIDSVNAARAEPMQIDYSWDAPGHIMARACRSDHFMYARRGIPIAFISRGYHQDYHVVTDEPQYINYDGLARVAVFVRDAAVAIANRQHRPRIDKPLMNPLLPCRH